MPVLKKCDKEFHPQQFTLQQFQYPQCHLNPLKQLIYGVLIHVNILIRSNLADQLKITFSEPNMDKNWYIYQRIKFIFIDDVMRSEFILPICFTMCDWNLIIPLQRFLPTPYIARMDDAQILLPQKSGGMIHSDLLQ